MNRLVDQLPGCCIILATPKPFLSTFVNDCGKTLGSCIHKYNCRMPNANLHSSTSKKLFAHQQKSIFLILLLHLPSFTDLPIDISITSSPLCSGGNIQLGKINTTQASAQALIRLWEKNQQKLCHKAEKKVKPHPLVLCIYVLF